ncbi:MAG: peptidylprolyl isomerase [Gammaproteobacteria bacterium]|nr:peptidylprolyl isomerase [Gammaproteobacteria bacterium]MCW8971874.1 peptidylprolyl isomerase [Gammaproteobacteria bacterium]MCW8994004.1 peptidylprolyl isomerase [Gammaproteobacteria bacterium]
MRLTPLFLLLFALFSPLHAAVQELNGIAAVVDDDVITWNELNKRVESISAQLRQRGNLQLPPREILERQILERLIIEKLQLNHAREVGLKVNDEQLNTIIGNIATENGLSLEAFRAALEADGMSFAFFREQIRNEVLISQLKSKQVDNRVNVAPHEVDAFLEARQQQDEKDTEYRLRHILVSLPGNASPEQVTQAGKKAEGLLSRLQQGEDFRQVAMAHSDGQQALEGGDLGWRRAGQLPTLFADIVMQMQPGELSPVIRSSSGFHILQLEQKRGEEKAIIRQVNARHILIRTSELVSDNEARERLQRLRERIVGGEDFAALARANSDDPGSATKGGELGWADPAIYVGAFTEALKETPVDQLSQPFQSQFGWHIVQPLGWRDHDNTDEMLRNQAFKTLRERKIEEQTQAWIRRLRDEAYVEYRLER